MKSRGNINQLWFPLPSEIYSSPPSSRIFLSIHSTRWTVAPPKEERRKYDNPQTMKQCEEKLP